MQANYSAASSITLTTEEKASEVLHTSNTEATYLFLNFLTATITQEGLD